MIDRDERLNEGNKRYGAKENADKETCPSCSAKGSMKETKETESAYWFECSKCGKKMSVPKD